MRNKKWFISALVLSMGLMGTGYAYWTKEITVDTTVSTANFDVYFTGVKGEKTPMTSGINNEHNVITTQLMLGDTVVTEKADKISCIWENIYPGSEATLTYTVANASSIPVNAQISCNLAADTSSELAEALMITMDGVTYTGFSDFQMAMNKKLLTLGKADNTDTLASTQDYTITFQLNDTVTDLNLASQTFNFDIQMTWSQFNNDFSKSDSKHIVE